MDFALIESFSSGATDAMPYKVWRIRLYLCCGIWADMRRDRYFRLAQRSIKRAIKRPSEEKSLLGCPSVWSDSRAFGRLVSERLHQCESYRTVLYRMLRAFASYPDRILEDGVVAQCICDRDADAIGGTWSDQSPSILEWNAHVDNRVRRHLCPAL